MSAPGFTLTELVIVLVVVGILASIALTRFNSTVERARVSEAEQTLRVLWGAQKRYALDHSGAYASGLNNLDVGLHSSSDFTYAVAAGPGTIATATRNGTSNALHVGENGTISCTPAGNWCDKLGY